MPAYVTLEQVVAEAKQYPPEDRLRLIQRVAETLLSTQASRPSGPLQYGVFAGPNMSSDEDFEIAKWRPSDKDLNGD